MRPASTNIGTNIPAFLSKLWKMVNDPGTDNLICWSADGHSFIIQNEAQFWYSLLPIYYKHNNMSSFIRQLNMYGFHKISAENGGLECDKDEIKFSHPYFQQDQPNLMKHIKRKIATTKSTTTSSGEDNKVNNVDQITKVLVDVKQLRGRQESVDSQLATMKQENAALWRELALLRQKHMKQQQIVNKLIHFLVTIVQPSRSGLGGLGVKRRYPLMINDSKYSKVPKTEPSSDGPTIHELDPESALTDTLLNDVATKNTSDNQIRIDSPPSVNSLIDSENVLLNIPIEDPENLTEDPLNSEILLVPDPDLETCEFITPDNHHVENLLADAELPETNVQFPLKDSDLSEDILQVAEEMYDNKNQNKESKTGPEEPVFEEMKFTQLINPNMKNVMISNVVPESEDSEKLKQTNTEKNMLAVATRNMSDISNFKGDVLDSHLEATQGELDSIKEMLFDSYSLDANALLGNLNNAFDAVPLQLFNSDEDFPLDIPSLTNSNESENKCENYDPVMSGSELTTYVNPPFALDFDNLFEDDTSDATDQIFEENHVKDDQINTPVVIKKEPNFPTNKHINSK